MTNITVRKNKPDDLATDPGTEVRQREGMADAGRAINDWMKDVDDVDPLAEEFFHDLFDKLDGPAETEHRFFVEVTDQNGDIKNKRIKARRRGFRFSLDGQRYQLKVKCREDQKQSNRKVKMSIGIPEKRGDLVAGGYVNTILNDLKTFITNGQDDRAKQYLLAVIFLNRCQ